MAPIKQHRTSGGCNPLQPSRRLERMLEASEGVGSSTGSTSFPKRARTLSVRQYGREVTTPETPMPVRAWIVTKEGDELGLLARPQPPN
ncbi:hypothetical protein GCM10010488_14960 [Oerskovia jenensis]|uniref:Uncharacterized protein n=1 Tax=Oerskovia jenensis TaxID=162169 RepID=A0ABS2L9R1_9CELL|nr:hypothetical protein [Oerskovia jenensis]